MSSKIYAVFKMVSGQVPTKWICFVNKDEDNFPPVFLHHMEALNLPGLDRLHIRLVNGENWLAVYQGEVDDTSILYPDNIIEGSILDAVNNLLRAAQSKLRLLPDPQQEGGKDSVN